MLQTYREGNIRSPEKVRDLWCNKLYNSRGLGDEKWVMLEQVAIAAMDLHDTKLIKETLTMLDNEFPKSSRIHRLKIMANLEMRERYEEALRSYDAMIAKDEANPIFYKRKIAVLIAQKRFADAIRELCEYLKKFMNDSEAWLELCSIYINEQAYHKAAFCMEELILTNPHNHLFHQRYAEIQYTINSPESLEIARAYFSQALKLNPANMRALYGLYLTVVALSNQPRSNSQKKKENAKLSSWAMAQISNLYKEKNRSDLQTVENMMSSLQI